MNKFILILSTFVIFLAVAEYGMIGPLFSKCGCLCSKQEDDFTDLENLGPNTENQRRLNSEQSETPEPTRNIVDARDTRNRDPEIANDSEEFDTITSEVGTSSVTQEQSETQNARVPENGNTESNQLIQDDNGDISDRTPLLQNDIGEESGTSKLVDDPERSGGISRDKIRDSMTNVLKILKM